MTLDLAPVTGGALLGDASLPAGARLVFRPTMVDTQGDLVVLDIEFVATLGDGGLLPDGFSLARNTSGTAGSAYVVDAIVPVAGPSGATVTRQRRLGLIQLDDRETFTLGELLAEQPAPAPGFYRILTTAEAEASLVASTSQADRSAVEAAAAEAARAAAVVAAGNAQASARTLASWSALSALTGAQAGEGAEVLDSDTGTHTDPVVGGTVANAGRYTWSASPAGWERIGATGLAGKAALIDLNARARPLIRRERTGKTHRFTAKGTNGRDYELASIDETGKIEAASEVAAPLLRQGEATLLAVESFARREPYPGVPIVARAANGSRYIVGFVPPSLGGGGGEDPAPSVVPDGDILQWAPSIIMDGVTDQSAQVKSAHDSAAASGYRSIRVEGPIYAPNALLIGDVHFRSATGRGALIGTPCRQRVIPDGAPTYTPASGIIPERHLARLRAKLATATPTDPAVMVFVSDSWGQPNQLVGWPSQFGLMLERELRRQFGPDAAKIRVVNRARGGSVWGDVLGAAGSTAGALWGVDPTRLWIDCIISIDTPDLTPTTRPPDAVVFLFGMNHGTWTATDIGQMQSVIAQVEAVTPKPDVILCTGTVPSVNDPPRSTRTAQEARRTVAAYTRHYARARGLGLIDFGRAFDAAHFGFDPCASSYRQIVFNAEVTLPYTFPRDTDDFAIRIGDPGAASTFWSTGDGQLTCTLSAVAGNRIVLERDAVTGNIAYTVYAANGIESIPRTVSAVAAVTSGQDPRLEIAAIGEFLTVRWRNITLLTTTIDRGGGAFQPVLGFGGGTETMIAEMVAVSDFLTVNPTLTDFDAWGGGVLTDPDDVDSGSTSPIGGNNINHLSELARMLIFALVLAMTRLGG